MNEINKIWQRIISFSSISEECPLDENFIFETQKQKIKFWLLKIDHYTVLPINEKNSKLFPITKKNIQNDLENNLGGNPKFTSKDFGTPAPSYRCALLNDARIWLK